MSLIKQLQGENADLLRTLEADEQRYVEHKQAEALERRLVARQVGGLRDAISTALSNLEDGDTRESVMAKLELALDIEVVCLD